MEFRLLVETPPPSPSSPPSFPLANKHYTLSPPLDILSATPFLCISYIWGPSREPHALDPTRLMSTHTRPSLLAAIQNSNTCTALWTDVFCVPPPDEPARQSTLENMGYIYSRATEVVVVLGGDTFDVVQKMIRREPISGADLALLERDEWVSSVWTYQEIVNGGAVRFVSEPTTATEPTPSISCPEFFSALGSAIADYKRSSTACTSTAVTFLHQYPHIDAFENILADWQTAGYSARSALSIFSSMSAKRNADPANFFYAMLGALTPEPEQLVWNDGGVSLAEKVMGVSEGKGDFSFVFTVEERERDGDGGRGRGRRWRPRGDGVVVVEGGGVPAVLRPILAWHCWGEGQRGRYEADGFWMDGMVVMVPASRVGDAGREAISRWVQRLELRDDDDAVIADAVAGVLRAIGFEGDGVPLVVKDGLVFGLEMGGRGEIGRIMVSCQIRWVMGAPGLVEFGRGEERWYTPCVFVGDFRPLMGDGESVLL